MPVALDLNPVRNNTLKSGSILETALTAGHFVVTAEIMPPKTPSASLIGKKAEMMRQFIDAANVTDNQSAVVRLASMAASRILLDNGIEPVMQITCRDRNRMAIQSDVLGAAALGIKNILCVTGDHQRFGNHPESKNVYDMDSIQLIRMLKRMRDDGRFQNEEPITNKKNGTPVPPRIYIGAAANPFAYPREYRPLRLIKKVNAGADFIQTQPIFDGGIFRKWVERIREIGISDNCHILAGITPVRSVSALIYMRDHVPGMYIPESVIARMQGASDMEREGFEMAIETCRDVIGMEGIHGLHIMAIGWEKVVPEMITELGLRPFANQTGIDGQSLGQEDNA